MYLPEERVPVGTVLRIVTLHIMYVVVTLFLYNAAIYFIGDILNYTLYARLLEDFRLHVYMCVSLIVTAHMLEELALVTPRLVLGLLSSGLYYSAIAIAIVLFLTQVLYIDVKALLPLLLLVGVIVLVRDLSLIADKPVMRCILSGIVYILISCALIYVMHLLLTLVQGRVSVDVYSRIEHVVNMTQLVLGVPIVYGLSMVMVSAAKRDVKLGREIAHCVSGIVIALVILYVYFTYLKTILEMRVPTFRQYSSLIDILMLCLSIGIMWSGISSLAVVRGEKFLLELASRPVELPEVRLDKLTQDVIDSVRQFLVSGDKSTLLLLVWRVSSTLTVPEEALRKALKIIIDYSEEEVKGLSRWHAKIVAIRNYHKRLTLVRIVLRLLHEGLVTISEEEIKKQVHEDLKKISPLLQVLPYVRLTLALSVLFTIVCVLLLHITPIVLLPLFVTLLIVDHMCDFALTKTVSECISLLHNARKL